MTANSCNKTLTMIDHPNEVKPVKAYFTKIFFILLVCLTISIVCSLTYIASTTELGKFAEPLREAVTSGNTKKLLLERNDTKMIMFWTRRANKRNWFIFSEEKTTRSVSSFMKCNYDCIITSDHSKLREADVLLFYRDEKPNWPKVRYAYQYYAHFNHEAPSWLGGSPFLRQYEGRINTTINFRRDADVYFPYNFVIPKESANVYQPRIPHRNKTKMVVWPVSHCSTYSRREDYVRELSKYIDVDIYGACGKYHCSRSRQQSCMKEWERKYMFYLSFENSICEDYITEKVFRPLQYELIPVVLGGGNYSRDMPPHSVINARDFNSPKHLAEFLLRLAADEQRYRSYFEWKSRYRIGGHVGLFICRLCEALHENSLPRRLAMRHYAKYWLGAHGEKCDNGLVTRMRKQGNW